MKVQKKSSHGGARKGAGRKKRAGWKQGSIAMPNSAWKGIKKLAARRKKRGEKNASAAVIAGELVESALVYFGLEQEKREELEAFARERGCTFDELVSEAIKKFLKQKNRKTSRPLAVNKYKFPAAALLALPAERRSSLLLLGVLVNETNWPYKLLVKALHALPRRPNERSDNPEHQTNLALTILLTTTLVGKIYEGWDCLCKGRLQATIAGLSLPDELKNLKTQLGARLSGDLFMRIRQNLAFHYHEKMIDFLNLRNRLDDRDTHFYVAAAGYQGDMLSHVSTLAMIDPLIGLSTLTPTSSNAPIDPKTEPFVAYERVLGEVIDVAGLYLSFVSTALAVLVNETFPKNLSFRIVTIGDAPEAGEERIHFFVHPPDNLEEIKAGKVVP